MKAIVKSWGNKHVEVYKINNTWTDENGIEYKENELNFLHYSNVKN